MSEAQKNNSQMTVGNNSNLTTNTRAAGAADFAKKNDITDKKKSDISSSGVFSYHKNLKDDGTKTQDKMVVVMKKDNVAQSVEDLEMKKLKRDIKQKANKDVPDEFLSPRESASKAEQDLVKIKKKYKEPMRNSSNKALISLTPQIILKRDDDDTLVNQSSDDSESPKRSKRTAKSNGGGLDKKSQGSSRRGGQNNLSQFHSQHQQKMQTLAPSQSQQVFKHEGTFNVKSQSQSPHLKHNQTQKSSHHGSNRKSQKSNHHSQSHSSNRGSQNHNHHGHHHGPHHGNSLSNSQKMNAGGFNVQMLKQYLNSGGVIDPSLLAMNQQNMHNSQNIALGASQHHQQNNIANQTIGISQLGPQFESQAPFQAQQQMQQQQQQQYQNHSHSPHQNNLQQNHRQSIIQQRTSMQNLNSHSASGLQHKSTFNVMHQAQGRPYNQNQGSSSSLRHQETRNGMPPRHQETIRNSRLMHNSTIRNSLQFSNGDRSPALKDSKRFLQDYLSQNQGEERRSLNNMGKRFSSNDNAMVNHQGTIHNNGGVSNNINGNHNNNNANHHDVPNFQHQKSLTHLTKAVNKFNMMGAIGGGASHGAQMHGRFF